MQRACDWLGCPSKAVEAGFARFLRYHDPDNWPLLRDTLKPMGRADLIGPGKHQLVPNWQPAGTGKGGGEGRRVGRKHGVRKFLTKGVHPVPAKAR